MTATLTASRSATPAPTTTGPGRKANIAVWGLQIFAAVFFAVASALPKLIAHPSATEGFDKIGYGDWFMYLIGTLELAGAIALVIPVLSGVAAIAFIGLMIGAFTYTVTVFDGEFWFTPVIVLAVMVVIAVTRRDQIARFVTLARRVIGRPAGGVNPDGRKA